LLSPLSAPGRNQRYGGQPLSVHVAPQRRAPNDHAALVEVAEDDPPGSALDNLLTVPFEELELRWSHRTGWVDDMEASFAAIVLSNDLQL
jgi:hypothetical protein